MALCGIISLLSFIGSSKADAVCEGIEIEFERSIQEPLVSEDMVRQTLLGVSDQIVGKNLRQVNYGALEDALDEIPHLNHSTVYTTIDHQLKVRVKERTPIIRLIDENGTSAFIDDEGYLMPLSSVSVLRLPIITGPFGIENEWMKGNLHSKDTIASPLLEKAHQIGALIYGDSFNMAQFQHMEMTENGELNVYPQVGNHIIFFGADDFEEKLSMLKIFYDEGMNQEVWNKYESINLKYKDQIVCTKK
jgi:cell division protein FtsQ